MWLMEYTVTPHTYMLTVLPCSCLGLKGSFARDMELYNCSSGIPATAASCAGAAVSAGATAALQAAAPTAILHLCVQTFHPARRRSWSTAVGRVESW